MKLHLESVSPELLETLQGLMDIELLAPAALGGGTSQALIQ